MRKTRIILNFVVAGLGLCMAEHAMAAKSSPGQYQSIPARNLFALKPTPPPLEPPPTGPTRPRIVLKGITTVCNRMALLKALFPAKPGEPAREQSYMLAPGQRDGDIEVLEVDEKAGSVKVKSFGTMMTITF